MRNTYTAAARAAHAPGDDTLARALKEALNSRALRARPSGHKCIDPARLRRGGGNASGRPAQYCGQLRRKFRLRQCDRAMVCFLKYSMSA